MGGVKYQAANITIRYNLIHHRIGGIFTFTLDNQVGCLLDRWIDRWMGY